jgi:outer membrane protein assembly factor BamB
MRLSVCLLLLLIRLREAHGASATWPQFRGPGGLAVADSYAPIHFNASSNVFWKTDLPAGNSSPCIWEDHIFLTAFENAQLETICLDRKDGHILWRRTAPVEKFEPTHRLGSPATPTPACDDKSVYVYFGSFGLLAYDHAGKEQWRRPLPTPVVEFGNSASPILANGRLIQVCDQDDGSYLLAVDAATGKTLWKIDRPEFRRSFATPLLWRHGDIQELVVPGSIWLNSYNLSDGSERWTYSGTSRVACSSPAAGDDLLFNASWNVGGDADSRITMPPFDEMARENDKDHDGRLTINELPAGPVRERFSQMDINKDNVVTRAEWEMMRDMFAKAGNAVLAIRAGGKGDVTGTHLAWKSTRSLPYVSSPLFYQGRLYTFKNGGLASCYEARTGKVLYQDERMGAAGDYYSSAIAAGENIYIASEKGIVTVLRAGDTFEVRARNDLKEEIRATPAVVEGGLYLRTSRRVYAFR